MENHIVRPRKKGHQHQHQHLHQQYQQHCNKLNSQTSVPTSEELHHHDSEQQLKQQQPTPEVSVKTNNSTGIGTSSPFKGSNGSSSHSNSSSSGVNQTGCSSVLSSPVRRCEVSPIQNHASTLKYFYSFFYHFTLLFLLFSHYACEAYLLMINYVIY